MFTCCPHCKTCFRITKAQLAVAQGKVRCGTCSRIFNAREHLHEQLPERKPKTPRPPPVSVPDSRSAPLHGETSTPPPTASTENPTGKTDNGPDLDLFDFAKPAGPEDSPAAATAPPAEEATEAETSVSATATDLDEETTRLDLAEFDAYASARHAAETTAPDSDDETPFDTEPAATRAAEEDTAIIDMRPAEASLADLFADAPASASPAADEASSTDETFPESSEEPDTAPEEAGESPATPGSRYAYVDPEELRPEEKAIDDIIAEMNAQLALETEPAEPSSSPPAPRDEAAPADATPEEPAPSAPATDDFESRFLADLDAALKEPLPAETSETPLADDHPPAPEVAPEEPAPPAEHGEPAPRDPATADEELPLPLREALVSETPPRHPWRFALKLLLVLLLTATLGIQLAVFRSAEIADAAPALRPLLGRICEQLPCRYHGPVDVDRIQLQSRDVRDHPDKPGALRIQATLVNTAPFPQPYPDMEITLSDLTGAVVAQRRFHPSEYLGSLYDPLRLMRPNQPVQVTLEVLNPGQDAVNFEFRFLRGTRD